ncbi:hypothetical protein BKI52_21720 [marine bacterium AO1-C]|nr:hypothetical protein BKI52_21720 [marine bacterium AO1-C]
MKISIKENKVYCTNPVGDASSDILLETIDAGSCQTIGFFVYDPAQYHNVDTTYLYAEQIHFLYFKDKNYVYVACLGYGSYCLEEFLIIELTEIDVDSFVVTHELEGYSKDKYRVYFGAYKIPGLIPEKAQRGEEIELNPNKKYIQVTHQVLYEIP